MHNEDNNKSTIGEAYSGAAKGAVTGGIGHLLLGKAGRKSKNKIIKSLSHLAPKLKAGIGIGAGIGAAKSMLHNSEVDKEEREKKAMEQNDALNFSKGFLSTLEKNGADKDTEDAVKATGAGAAVGTGIGEVNKRKVEKKYSKELDDAWERRKLKESNSFKKYKGMSLNKMEGHVDARHWEGRMKKTMKNRFRSLKGGHLGKGKGALLGAILGIAGYKMNKKDD